MDKHKIFNIISAVLCVIGAVLQLSHMEWGRELVLAGLVLGSMSLSVENTALKKQLKDK